MKKRGGWIRFGGGRGVDVQVLFLFLFFVLTVISPVHADLGPDNLLILVNSNSATSQYVAKMYRQYYPQISDIQVVELSGLADCSGPSSTAADEIITRDVYNASIAEPVRDHLSNNGLLDQIMAIVTTAGMPYRIEDTSFNIPDVNDVVGPASSSWATVGDHEDIIDAASVESELTCLWYADDSELGNSELSKWYPDDDDPNNDPFFVTLRNRIVNPYQGCKSPFDLFPRQLFDASNLHWVPAWSKQPGIAAPIMEGEVSGYGAKNRIFSPGHIYLTCRLDGPKQQRKSAVFAVREILERSKRASDFASGVNPNQAVVVIDDAPEPLFGNDKNRVFNLHNTSVDFWMYSGGPFVMPDAYGECVYEDYIKAFFNFLCDDQMYEIGNLNFCASQVCHGIPVLEDYRSNQCTAAYGLDFLADYFPNRSADQGVVAFCCYGRNGDEGRNSTYLLDGGLGGGPLYKVLNGAVFTSIESFNGLTLFSDADGWHANLQANIIDFIHIGGSGAIGHSFEPQEDAIIDNEFFFYNFLADETGPEGIPDNRADLTFVEAAWTGIPYLSWAEVVLGDPLMRIAYGPGEAEAWEPTTGDVNRDGAVNIRDLVYLRNLNRAAGNPGLYDSIAEKREKYQDLYDLNQDGCNNIRDMVILRNLIYSY